MNTLYTLQQGTTLGERQFEEKTFRRISLRIVPIIFLCYVISIFDRVNIAFAKLQMMDDIGLSASAYGLGAGVFFVGYWILEVPSNIILARVGARTWITRIMLTWGMVTIATAFIQNTNQYYLARFALGVAEAGFYPGVLYFINSWFPRARHGRVLALFILASPLSNALSAPVCGFILAHATVFAHTSLAAWQWLFIISGVPALVMGAIVYAVIRDNPNQAVWLTNNEKAVVGKAIVREGSADHSTGTYLEAFKNWKIWVMGFIMATVYLGIYAIMFWLPTIVKSIGIVGFQQIGLVSASPWLVTALLLPVIGYLSDRNKRRRGFFCASTLLGCLGFVLSVAAPANITLSMAGLCAACAFLFSACVPLWALVSEHVSGKAAAAGLALVNSIASVGSFLGPYLMGAGQDVFGSLRLPLLLMAASCVVGALVIWTIPEKRKSADELRLPIT